MQHLSMLAFRNLRVRFIRTLLTIMGIVLGVAVILAISITNQSTLDSIETVFDEASGKAHLVVEESSTTGEGFEQSVAERVETIEGVEVAVPSATARTLLASQTEEWQWNIAIGGGGRGNDLLLLGIDPALDREARVYLMVAGQFLKPGDDSYTVVLVKDFADDEGIEVGEDLTIITPEGTEKLTVIGLIKREGPGTMNDGAMGVIPLPVLQDIFSRGDKIDQIDVVAEAAVANSTTRLADLKSRLEERLGHNYSVVYPAARGKLIAQMLATYQQGLGFFSAIALFVGAFLIYNVFSMTVMERTREIGMLRAVGATRRQVLALVLGEALLLGLVGSILGVLGGIGLSRGLIRLMSSIISIEITEASVPPSGLTTSLLVGMVVTLVSALLPARRASQITPLEALRPMAANKASWLGRYSWVIGLELILVAWLAIYHIPFRRELTYPVGSTSIFTILLGATLTVPIAVLLLEGILKRVMTTIYGGEGLVGSGNVQRARGRTALTVAALMVGVAMIIGIGAMTDSFRKDILKWVDTTIGGDLYVRSPMAMRPELGKRLATVPGVRDVSGVRFFSVKRVALSPQEEDDSLVFVGLDPMSYTRVAAFQFASGQGPEEPLIQRLAEGDAVFISTLLSDKYGLEQGDVIRLATNRGERDFYVAAVIVDFTAEGYAITGSWRDMRRYFGLNNVNSYVIKLLPGFSNEEVRKYIEDHYEQRYHIQVESSHEFKDRIIKLTDESFALFNVLVLIGVIVAGLGVINTLMMNVLERLREIGMLRSLGMTKRQISKMILAESGTMGAIGGAFGLGFGLVLSKIFVLALNALAGYTIKYALPFQSVLASLLVALVVSQVAALYPAWRAAQVNIVSAIQHE
ncbi:MAG: ABC transporter permease [Anaerolineae bacterium]